MNAPLQPALAVNHRLAANSQGTDWVCSDLHGHLPLLKERLNKAGFNPQIDRLILLGDLTDRGPCSLETLNWVLDSPFCYSVAGNHELMLLAAQERPELVQKRRQMCGGWTDNLSPDQVRTLAVRIQQNLPLTLTIEHPRGDIGIVHAQSPVDDWQTLDSLIFSESLAKRCTWDWSRSYQPVTTHIQGITAVVSGHIGADQIIRKGNQLWIDTLEKTGCPTLLSVSEILSMFPERPTMLMSGGQTGVDRAALDWAITNNLEHGGWCPAGRIAADGVLDRRYQLSETESNGYRQRNKLNVQHSDATLIIYRGVLEGGSQLTQVFANKFGKACLPLNLDTPTDQILSQWHAWRTTHRPAKLNVAGPSEARCPSIYQQTLALLDLLLLPHATDGKHVKAKNHGTQ
jgi:serine/threonine protein phosphatase 1